MFRTFLCAMLCLAALVAAPAALAASYPVRAMPEFGSTVATAPQMVQIWFDHAVQPVYSTVTVTDSSGASVSGGNGTVNRRNQQLLETRLTPDLPAGTYMVQWSALASDGKQTNGHYTFTVEK